MQSLKDRLRPLLAAISPAQRVVIGVSLAVLALVGFVFYSWLTSPSYTVLFANMDNTALSAVITQLQSMKATYQLNGNTVMVPMANLYTDRAQLAAAKVGGPAVPPGFELFDNQSLTASSFTQQVDYQRALQGEMDQTIDTMANVRSAQVSLAMPTDTSFTTNPSPITASVLLDTVGTLPKSEVDTVVFIVSSGVPGLTASNVTVADSAGDVLSAPGTGASSVAGDQESQQQQSLEASLTADVQRLVTSATGKAGAVVVHADMNFNQSTIQNETYGPNSVPLSTATTTETLTGNPTAAAGLLGQAGGALANSGATNTATTYGQGSSNVTYGAAHSVTQTTVVPGAVQKLSVGVVVDSAALTHAPSLTQLTQLISAALGLDAARGDTINVTSAPFPASAGAAGAAKPKASLLAAAPQVAAAAVLVLVAAFLLLMARGRRKVRGTPLELDAVTHPALGLSAGAGALVTTDGAALVDRPRVAVAGDSARADVMEMVTRQPEEIATLLRSWLADRRS